MKWLIAVLALAGAQAQEEKKAEEGLPLEVAETLEFTVDEVTWMSLDVSPDGTTLVFDLLGDLYTLPVTGGEATRIVGGMSFESQPRYSPDGTTIAFLSDRSGVENLWIADADGGNPRAVGKDKPTKSRPQLMTSPAWTDDGDYILVSKQRTPERTFGLFMYHRDGGTGVRVGEAHPRTSRSPRVSPPRSARVSTSTAASMTATRCEPALSAGPRSPPTRTSSCSAPSTVCGG